MCERQPGENNDGKRAAYSAHLATAASRIAAPLRARMARSRWREKRGAQHIAATTYRGGINAKLPPAQTLCDMA